MLQLSTLRENPEWVKERLTVKKSKHQAHVDLLIDLDKEKRKKQVEADQIAQQLKLCAKEIGTFIAQKNTSLAEEKKQHVNRLKKEHEVYLQRIETTEKRIYDLLVELPNLPLEEVPQGNGSEDNEIVRSTDIQSLQNKNAIPHWDIAKKYDLIDFEIGSLVTGSGFPFYKGMGAILQRKLVDYFLDFNRVAGYTEYQTPLMVNQQSAFSTGQLPDKEGQMYHATEDDFYLIPTAEVPLTNIYRNRILSEAELPIKLTGYTPCFRREAGSYGKDVRGLNRLHQFDKVEIVQIVEPRHSRSTLDEMVLHVERLIQSLGLPYRILKLCGGDMGFASALTFDFEVYSVAQQRWLEVSSVSNFGTFQSNRLALRYKNPSTKETELLHTLNGSSLALPRIVAALLECYQTEHGIQVPEVLIPYLKTEYIS